MRSNRKRNLAAVCVVMALGYLVACTSGPSRTTTPTTSDTPSVHPSKVNVDRFHTTTPIKHVVFIIKENRSFDNLFGRFPGANGITMGNLHGKIIPLTPAFDGRYPHDLPHDYTAALAEWDHGKMDAFDITGAARKYAYTQMQGPQDLPNYWNWAQNYVLSDDFFASVNGPSFPNHMFTIAASSFGTHDNPEPPAKNDKGTYKTWGCDAPKSEKVIVADTEGHMHDVSPCFDKTTEADLLQHKGIPWAYYAAPPVKFTDPQHSGYIWSAFASIRHIRDNRTEWRDHIFPVQQVVQDIQANRLPPVTWITPQFADSEHPEYNFCYGENWTTRVVDAIMRSPEWKSTAIFITWDDWGGFYDHVPPTQIDKFGLGIRVPLLVISPYAKQGFVDHSRAEFSSILKFIETNWQLPTLTKRDAEAGDLFEAFDFSEAPRAPDPRPLRTDCHGPEFSPAPISAYK